MIGIRSVVLFAVVAQFSVAQTPGSHSASGSQTGQVVSPGSGNRPVAEETPGIYHIINTNDYGYYYNEIPKMGGNAFMIIFTAKNCPPCRDIMMPKAIAAAKAKGVPLLIAEVEHTSHPLHPVRQFMIDSKVKMPSVYPVGLLFTKNGNGFIQQEFRYQEDIEAVLDAKGAKRMTNFPKARATKKSATPTLPVLGLGSAPAEEESHCEGGVCKAPSSGGL